VARPNGTINTTSGTDRSVRIALDEGTMTINGATAGNAQVQGKGTLLVQLSERSNTPWLTFTEKGLASTERAIGFVSPFVVGGHPLRIPVKKASQLPNC